MGKLSLRKIFDKQTQVVMFSSIAIALYGYDQGEQTKSILKEIQMYMFASVENPVRRISLLNVVDWITRA